MNCYAFEKAINDLARESLMDAALRKESHAHAEECERCSSRLADERALSEGLRALASQTAERETPARAEAALLESFRESRRAAQNAHAATHAKRSEAAFVSKSRVVRLPDWARASAAAAAGVLVVFSLFSFYRNQTNETPSAHPNKTELARKAGSASEGNFEGERNESAAKGGEVSGDSRAENSERAASVVADAGASVDESAAVVESADASAKRGGTFERRANQRLASHKPKRKASSPVADDDGAQEYDEIATGFIPLMNGGQLSSDDAGHVVRVELPRTALASFGLPVNADQMGGRVKADVLMGADGIARAIRFVR